MIEDVYIETIPCTRHDEEGTNNYRLRQALAFAFGYLEGKAKSGPQAYAAMDSVVALHDHKGFLKVTYKGELQPLVVEAFNLAWKSPLCCENDVVFMSEDLDWAY